MRKSPSRVTVEEIVADLGLGRIRVYQLLDNHVIPNIKVGHRYLVTRHAYEEWKKTCGVLPPPIGAQRMAS